ncbi:N-acetyl-gamma-glutamyl-phosphate reductase [Alteribacter populi]|uniref:N-acetyl-gamma-glutamyl-phosphate reductase n=1 Tax=Alteribacter populi TaxID=2011011 RepID=UPI000BBA6509|nr:N-acetyl-gamma-glutamyl-phosphate reductase [Alteribacter populi]
MNAAIIGGTGYGANELIRLLDKHPLVNVKSVISNSQANTEIKQVFPHLTDLVFYSFDEFDIHNLKREVDLVFFATPSGISKEMIPKCIENRLKCVDLSGDFRFTNPKVYETWYSKPPAAQSYLNEATYGLSELYESEIKRSSLIANPGCYPTATLLGLVPLLKKGWAELGSIVIDGKSGVSGAGRSLSANTHYAEINENVKAYKLGAHQHIPEIEQILASESQEHVKVSFTTHLVPMTRGLMCTISVQLKKSLTTKEIIDYYQSVYEAHPFVRVRSEGVIPSTKDVYTSNFCDIGLHYDSRTGRLTIISVIDNLVKGAAGQAIQNVNLMNGWDERTGLMNIPVYP